MWCEADQIAVCELCIRIGPHKDHSVVPMHEADERQRLQTQDALARVEAVMSDVKEAERQQAETEAEQEASGLEARAAMKRFFGRIREAALTRERELQAELDLWMQERVEVGSIRRARLAAAKRRLEAVRRDLQKQQQHQPPKAVSPRRSEQGKSDCDEAEEACRSAEQVLLGGETGEAAEIIGVAFNEGHTGDLFAETADEFIRAWGRLEWIMSKTAAEQPPSKLSPPEESFSSSRDWESLQASQYSFGSRGSAPGQFQQPAGLALDTAGNILVAEWGNHRLQLLTADGQCIQTFGCKGSAPGRFEQPWGVALDSAGNYIVTEWGNHRVQVISSTDGQPIRIFGSRGSDPGQFKHPRGVAVDAADNMIIADQFNHRIQVIGADGQIISVFGSKGSELGQFQNPMDVALDAMGNIIVADYGNHRIQVVSADGRFIRAFGSAGRDLGQFQEPWGVAVDAAGNIIVAEWGNHRVQVVTKEGSFHFFGAEGVEPGQFKYPWSVVADMAGNIAVAEYGNHRVQIW